MDLRILLIIILLLASAFFSCSETALFSPSRSEVARFKVSKGGLAKGVIDALSKPRQLLVSILLGNELVNVAISILVAALVYELLPEIKWQIKIFMAVAVSTPLIVVVGEVIPKNIGIRFASAIAPACAVFICAFSRVTAPIRKILLKLADSAIMLFKGDPANVRSMIMEEEFRQMVEVGRDEGSLGEAEEELIHRVFDMADKTVEEVMTPKEAIFGIGLDAASEDAISEIRTTQFSRIPVYDSCPDDIVGILHVRDLFSVMRRRKVGKIREVENIIRPAYFMPMTMTLEETLNKFKKMKTHMAIVVDKDRKPIGIIPMDVSFGALFEE